jgi:hypothetical protein
MTVISDVRTAQKILHHVSTQQVATGQACARRAVLRGIPVGTPEILTKVLRACPQSRQANAGVVTRLVADRFPPNPFKFSIQ